MTRFRFFRLSMLCALLWTLSAGVAGCGYSTTELFPDTYRSVSVDIFQNRTFYRGVEFDLTEALVKEIEQRTPYTTRPANVSDTVLTGTVTYIETRQLSRTNEAGLPQEVEVIVTIDFEWKDQRSGEVLASRKGFSGVGRYVPTQPVGERFEIGQHAAVQRLARDIVSAMRGDW